MNRRDQVTAGLFILAVAALIITLSSFATGLLLALGYLVGGAIAMVGAVAVIVKPSQTRKR